MVLRTSVKTHGNSPGSMILAGAETSVPVTLIEDTVTTGKSLMKTKDFLESLGYTVNQILSIVNRSNSSIPFEYIWDLNEICHSFKRIRVLNTINTTGVKLCVAADVDSVDRLKELIELLQLSENDILKIHGDLYKDITQLTLCLTRLKSKYNFLVWDDRKFADIPSIMKRQIKSIESYADMVTVVPSVAVARELTYFPLIALGQMTTWTKNSGELKALHNYANAFVGIVLSPKALVNPFIKCAVFMPGIKIFPSQHTTDDMGQVYSRPKINFKYAVVGRAIVCAEDVKVAYEAVKDKIKDL